MVFFLLIIAMFFIELIHDDDYDFKAVFIFVMLPIIKRFDILT